MNWRERIESDQGTLHGKPRIRGTRIPVSVVLDNLAARMDLREVLASYPALSEDDVRACVAYAADALREPKEDASPDAAEAARAPASAPAGGDAHAFWSYLMSIPSGCQEADFERPLDYGRPAVEWD